ncbi:MAG: hypothetical protein WBM46_04645 [Polyangiales bacterium]
MTEPRTIHFVSLGCAKTRVVTEMMRGVSDQSGFELLQDPAKAEVIVINTCGFIGPATESRADHRREDVSRSHSPASGGRSNCEVGTLRRGARRLGRRHNLLAWRTDKHGPRLEGVASRTEPG